MQVGRALEVVPLSLVIGAQGFVMVLSSDLMNLIVNDIVTFLAEGILRHCCRSRSSDEYAATVPHACLQSDLRFSTSLFNHCLSNLC